MKLPIFGVMLCVLFVTVVCMKSEPRVESINDEIEGILNCIVGLILQK